jgi:hypothetical protein
MLKLMKTLELHGRILFDVIWSRNEPKRLLDKFFCRNCTSRCQIETAQIHAVCYQVVEDPVWSWFYAKEPAAVERWTVNTVWTCKFNWEIIWSGTVRLQLSERVWKEINRRQDESTEEPKQKTELLSIYHPTPSWTRRSCSIWLWAK